MESDPNDGVRNIVIGTPFGEWRNDRVEGEPRQAAEFYAALLGWQIVRNDWMKIGTDPERFPHIAFGDGWSDGRQPRWGDAEHPVQAHVDIAVPDVAAAVGVATAAGATLLADIDGGHAVVGDPFGHPVCLRQADGAASLRRVVLDCAPGQADDMAAFYDALLGAGAPDAQLLGFQEIGGFVPTTWPDDDYPAQLHLDLQFADVDAAVARAETAGAERLPSLRPNARIFADPAGHPVCLCTLTGG